MEYEIFFIKSNGKLDSKKIFAFSKDITISHFNQITLDKYEIKGVITKKPKEEFIYKFY